MSYPFNIRVYGLLIWQDSVLLSYEEYKDWHITKFPGGGLEFGEGTIAALKREFREELNIEIGTIEHFYTTDFFQPSVINPSVQVVSVYYTCTTLEHTKINVSEDLNELNQRFYWVQLNRLKPEMVSLPIDQKVVEMLNERYQR